MDQATRRIDLDDASLTENTRGAYPIGHLPNVVPDGRGGHPRHVIMLTADAFGVLPPIARLSPAQAMYHFMSGYTAKVAGTERGVTEPQATFSACFGAPFMPLHPSVYAGLLGERLQAPRGHPLAGQHRLDRRALRGGPPHQHRLLPRRGPGRPVGGARLRRVRHRPGLRLPGAPHLPRASPPRCSTRRAPGPTRPGIASPPSAWRALRHQLRAVRHPGPSRGDRRRAPPRLTGLAPLSGSAPGAGARWPAPRRRRRRPASTPSWGRMSSRPPSRRTSSAKASMAQACGVKRAMVCIVLGEDLDGHHGPAHRRQPQAEQHPEAAGLLLVAEDRPREHGRARPHQGEGITTDGDGPQRIAPVDPEDQQRPHHDVDALHHGHPEAPGRPPHRGSPRSRWGWTACAGPPRGAG